MRARARIGLIGGGQLGRLLLLEARALGVEVRVLDPDPHCPAAGLADGFIAAPFDDAGGLARLAQGCDAVTLEIEAPPAALLRGLEQQGVPVHPGAAVLAVVQDKLTQRRHFRAQGIPQPRFVEVSGAPAQAVAAFGGPCVLKARRSGYDGRGVLALSGPDDPALAQWHSPALLEQKIDLAAELAVVVVRAKDGSSRVYDPVELLMDPQRHVLDLLLAPARVAPSVATKAQALALQAVQSLDGVGAFGVELFMDQAGQLLLNEVSPRVHNSGHHSLEACATSQFANHLRAVLGWPLGPVHTLRAAATANLLGPAGLQGPYLTRQPQEAASGVHLHLYGKRLTSPGRKLGHVTAVADDVDTAQRLARAARQSITFVEGA